MARIEYIIHKVTKNKPYSRQSVLNILNTEIFKNDVKGYRGIIMQLIRSSCFIVNPCYINKVVHFLVVFIQGSVYQARLKYGNVRIGVEANRLSFRIKCGITTACLKCTKNTSRRFDLRAFVPTLSTKVLRSKRREMFLTILFSFSLLRRGLLQY